MLVITDEGEQLGVLSKQDALKAAQKKGLDLVLVAPDAKPAVAKFMNYSKYRFDQQKRQKEMKKNQRVIQVKEIRLSPTIEKHDFETKVRNARKFLEGGDKVKVSLRFIGRVIVHADVGEKVVQDFAQALADVSIVDSKMKLEGKSLTLILAPKTDK